MSGERDRSATAREARREAELNEYVAEILAAAPPPSDEVCLVVRRLLGPDSAAAKREAELAAAGDVDGAA